MSKISGITKIETSHRVHGAISFFFEICGQYDFFLQVCFHIMHSYYSGGVQKGPPCPGRMLLSRENHPAGIFFHGFAKFWKLGSHFFITFSVVRFGELETNEHLSEKHNVM